MQNNTPDLAAITLAILAGGKGSRMGAPKAMLTLDTVPILAYLLKHLCWPGPTLLVTAPGRERPPGADLFSREVTDPVPNLGPLRGIITALQNTATEQTLILPVDMPSIRCEHLSWLATGLHHLPSAHGLMTERTTGGRHQIEPMPAALRRSALPTLESALAAGNRSIHALASQPGFNRSAAPSNWPREIWINLNTKADLDRYVLHSDPGSNR